MLTRLRETDGWNRRFDKLPVIFAKLSLRVTGADEAETADTIRYLESVLRQTARDFRKAELRVMGADEAEKADTLRYLELVVCEQAQLLRKLAPLRSLNGFFDF